jgi:hypothetical protein
MGKKQKQLSPEEQRERAEARRIANGVADGTSDNSAFKGTCNKCGKQGHRAADCTGASGGGNAKPEPAAKVGKGHKQSGAGAVLTARGPVETKCGVVKKDWQRLPSQMLHEFCQREKRPNPIYHHPREVSKNKNGKGAADDDDEDEEDWKKYIKPPDEVVDVDDNEPKQYKQRVMLPDPKFKERSLTFCPVQASPTKELAKEHTALLALLHVCGNLPLDRKLPDEFREVWLASQSSKQSQPGGTSNNKKEEDAKKPTKNKTTDSKDSKANEKKEEISEVKDKLNKAEEITPAANASTTTSAAPPSTTPTPTMSLSADSKFASKADRRLHEMKKNQEMLDRQRRREAIEKANADPSVLMSNKMRMMIELALGIKNTMGQPQSSDVESKSNEEIATSKPKASSSLRSTSSSSSFHIRGAFVDESAPYGFTKSDTVTVLSMMNSSGDGEMPTEIKINETISSESVATLFILFHRLLTHVKCHGSDLNSTTTTSDLSVSDYAESLETELMILESMYADCFQRIDIDGFGSLITISPEDLPVVDILLPNLSSTSLSTLLPSSSSIDVPLVPPALLVRGLSLSNQLEVTRKYHECLQAALSLSASEPPCVLADMFSYLSENVTSSSSSSTSDNNKWISHELRVVGSGVKKSSELTESLMRLGKTSPLTAPKDVTSLSDAVGSLNISDEKVNNEEDEDGDNKSAQAKEPSTVSPAAQTQTQSDALKRNNSNNSHHRRKGFWDMDGVCVKLNPNVPVLIRSSRESLPASKAKQEILDTLNSHQTILIAGGLIQ